MNLEAAFGAVHAEWLAIAGIGPPDLDRFAIVKGEADRLVDEGLWTSGPSDMLSVLGRQRDELMHSRLLAWLLVPTNRHGLGRRFLTGFLDSLWPGENLLRSGPVFVDIEITSSGVDESGTMHLARADIVLRGDDVTVVVENKLDAAEQPEQCERLYWAYASDPGDTRWVLLTPTGRAPLTASSEAASRSWRSMSYTQVRLVLASALDDGRSDPSTGRTTASQYLASLSWTAQR